jgi:hypothetical protein
MTTNNPYLDLLARLETRGGEATIKGPKGEDSNNLFNIKETRSGKVGYSARDKAEGSNDAYRVYATRDESVADAEDLLSRRYPEAYSAMQKPWSDSSVAEFATGLKKRGYATDPDYVKKLLGVAKNIDGSGYTPTASRMSQIRANTEAVNSLVVRPDAAKERRAQLERDSENWVAQVKAEAAPTMFESFGAAMAGNTDQDFLKPIKQYLFGERFPAQAGFVPDVAMLPPTADRNLIDNFKATKSLAEAQSILDDHADKELQQRTVMAQGTWTGVGLSLAAELPTLSNLVPSLAAAKVARLAGLANSVELAAAGRTGAMTGALIAENVASGTVVEALRQRVTGEYSLADLGLAATADVAFGLGSAALAARAGGKMLHTRAIESEIAKEQGFVLKAQKELGTSATPDELAARAGDLRKAELENVVRAADTHEVPAERRLLDVREEEPKAEQPAVQADAPGNAATAERKVVASAPVKDSLEAALTSPALTAEVSPNSRGARQLIAHLLNVLPESVLKNEVNFVGYGARGSYNFVTDTIDSPGRAAADLMPQGAKNNEAVVLAHEVVHAATAKMIEAVEGGKAGVSRDMIKAVQNLGAIRRDLEAELRRLGTLDKSSNSGANYATKNLHEFVAQVMSDNDTRQVLAKMPAKGFADRLSEFADAVMRLLGFNPKNKTALQEAVTLIDKIIKEGPPAPEPRATVTRLNGPEQSVAAIQTDPDVIRFGLSTLPVETDADRAMVKQLVSLHKKAEAWAVKNPMDEEYKRKVQNLTDNNVFNVASTGLIMLKSESPLARMIASELLEDASGVQAGRKDTAAIAKYLTQNAIMGNAINDYQGAYTMWQKTQKGAGHWDDMIGGQKKAEFDKLVASEIEARRVAKQPVTTDGNVKAAADVMEAAYTRAANQQKKAKTLGWAALPENSVGYMPHKMSPAAVRNLTNEQQQILHSALTDQFISIEGWDASFSDMLASKYLKRVRDRAAGDYGSVIGQNSMASADIIEDALRAMNLPREEIKAQMERYTKGAANFTKSRIELDLNKVYETADGSFRLMDIFETNQIELLRSQAGRASGEVALAKYGVFGRPGLDTIREALKHGADGQRAGLRELEAFDQVAAEFMNEPFGSQSGKFMERAMAANTLVRMGGIVFNQLAETLNGVFHVGALRTAESIASIPRLNGEIRALARGEAVDNPIIGSIELIGGGEFGTDNYKFVMPFDSPDHAYPTYGRDTLTLTDRLLRGGNHAQSVLSGWRMIHSAQQRGMAEQIVHKMMRYVRDGGDDIALRDFGITEEVQAFLKDNLAKVATFEGDRLVRFEADKLPDSKLRDQVIQAVHRGTSQIIQGTFIGERGKWAHDGFLKLLTQFRSFSITSMEKQWGRQRNNRGGYAAFGMALGAMSITWPVYAARVYANSIGRPDQEEYIAERMTPQNVARATLNYIALSGMAGDFIDLTSAVAPDAVKEAVGFNPMGSTGKEADLVGNYVLPSAGLANDAFKWLQSPTEIDDLAKIMPLSRLPYLVPLMNTTKEE